MINILRLRVGVPGHGAKLSRLLQVPQVSQSGKLKVTNRSPHTSRFGFNCDLWNYGVAHDTAFLEECRRRGIKIYNDPNITKNAANKLQCLQILNEHGVKTLGFTTDIAEAVDATSRGRVFCRTKLKSKKGKGIVIASRPEEVVKAPLYTFEFPKTHEYRIHVFGGECIDWVQKKRAKRLASSGEVNEDVRNRSNGWVFAHTNRKGSPRIRQIGIDAVKALGLDYGAVDVLAQWDERNLVDCVVCEVNTAPGLTAPTSLKAYLSKMGEL